MPEGFQLGNPTGKFYRLYEPPQNSNKQNIHRTCKSVGAINFMPKTREDILAVREITGKGTNCTVVFQFHISNTFLFIIINLQKLTSI